MLAINASARAGGLILRDDKPLLWQFDGGYVSLNENGTPTSWNYYITDHLSSTRKVVDSKNNVKETINYYPFGSEMRMQDPAQMAGETWQPYRFTSKELDNQNGLNWYDFGARWFDVAGVPMWTSVDPLAEKNPSLTPYHFCHNDPVNRIDPDGKDDYMLDNSGNLIFLKRTDSENHTLYAQDNNGNIDTNNSLLVSKNLISSKDTKSYKGRQGSDINKNVSTYSVDFYSSTNEQESIAFFEFATKCTHVEWSNTRVVSPNGNTNYISTSHNERSELGQRAIIDGNYGCDYSNSHVEYANHSHLPTSIGFSYGDINLAKAAVKRNPNIILQIYNGNDYQVYDQYYIPGVINEVICNGRANKKK